MKRILSLFLALLLLGALSSAVFAYGTSPLVVDEAGLLTDSQREALLKRAEEITERQRCDVAIVVVKSLEGKSSMDYADDWFDYRGYGYGPGNDGVLLLVPVAERDAWITTHGYGITAFTDYGIDYVFDEIVDALGSDDDWYAAFEAYLTTCDALLTQARAGNPLDNYYGDSSGNVRGSQRSFGETVKGQLRPGVIILSLVIGFVIALIPMAIHRGKVKNVKWQQNATNYLRDGSMRLDVQRDQFLFVNTTSRRIETNRSSGGGGGSSTHTSSSGSTHGGGGRHL